MKKLSALLTLFIVAPIWYYLVYVMLGSAHVDRLVWFLYWVYLPVGVFIRVLDIITDSEDKSKKP